VRRFCRSLRNAAWNQLLTTALGDPRPERGGKPRRVVTPTRDGVAAVRATMTAIHAMTHGVKI
jgi:hypothetical protein